MIPARGVMLVAVAVAVAAAAMASSASAQGTLTRVTVSGIAYDSLRGEPLRDAFVTILGMGRSTTSDDAGRFRFDSLPAGTYTFATQHAAFDSIGLSGASVRLSVASARDTIRLAVPSFAALWRAACGAAPAPSDSGLVFGAVRSAANGRPSRTRPSARPGSTSASTPRNTSRSADIVSSRERMFADSTRSAAFRRTSVSAFKRRRAEKAAAPSTSFHVACLCAGSTSRLPRPRRKRESSRGH